MAGFRRFGRRRRQRPKWLVTQYNAGPSNGIAVAPATTIIPILSPNTQMAQFAAAGLQLIDSISSWVILRITGRILWKLHATASAGRANDTICLHHGIFVEEYDEVTGFPTSAVTNTWLPQSGGNIDSRWMWHDTEALDVPAAVAFDETNISGAVGPRFGLIDIAVRRRMSSRQRLYWTGTLANAAGAIDGTITGTVGLQLRVLAQWKPFMRQGM